jgi:hypothetical protein
MQHNLQAPTIKVRNELHSKMLLPTIITTLHNNLHEKQNKQNFLLEQKAIKQ